MDEGPVRRGRMVRGENEGEQGCGPTAPARRAESGGQAGRHTGDDTGPADQVGLRDDQGRDEGEHRVGEEHEHRGLEDVQPADDGAVGRTPGR